MQRLTRREIVIAVTSAGVTGAATLLFRRPHSTLRALAQATTAPASPVPALKALTEAEYVTLAAACERIYPQDDAPGALALDVPQFIDASLASSPLPGWSDGLLTSVARLDIESFRRYALPFAGAKVADQDALIDAWAAEPEGDNRRFVNHLVVATLEGVLADPVHGGNRGAAGWKTFGLGADPYTPSEVRRP